MVDRLTPAARSALMGKVRGKNSGPELSVRRLLHRLGFRYRLHRRDLPGTPDIVFPSRRRAIFVHGCFWHRHEQCKKASLPKSNVPFWTEKFEVNVQRDRRNVAELRALGWAVLIVWQCETEREVELEAALREFLIGGDVSAERLPTLRPARAG
ncbi:MAG TPA: very short patch repair endonuclease [Devosia sp.]|uniref:very short patch repair endonuclease n=1 Tax=Devosia sp. TaxID=1871048 RepID=UPI002DDCFD4C|nr:very short patch repair endonuclease [Devosia sp.]HEV2517822.1 very short patch repair endonuclease [Devosia sp.]